MATQAYFPRTSGKKIDIRRLAQTNAPGHPPDLQPKAGASNRTPAPTRAPTTTAEMARSTSWGRSSGDAGDNPGKNGFAGASSLNPSEKAGPATIDPHGPAGADPVLRNLVMGTKRAIDGEDSWQTRSLDDPADRNRGGVPIHEGTQGARPGPTIPAKTGTLNDDADARYAQARGSK